MRRVDQTKGHIVADPINWYTPRNVYHDPRRLEEQRKLDEIVDQIRARQNQEVSND